jgi:hypothetical protein
LARDKVPEKELLNRSDPDLNLVAAGFCKLFSAFSAVNLYFVIPEFIWKIAKEKNRMKTGPKAYNPGGEK